MEFILCAALLSSQAEVGDWYATGGVFLENVEYDVPSIDFGGGLVSNPFTIEFDQETSFRFGVGTRLNENFNLEFNFGSGSGEITESSGGLYGYAEYDYTTFGAMLAYPIEASEKLTFTPKAGLGFTQLEGGFLVADSFGDFVFATIDDSDLTLKLEASAEYSISESANIFAGYRIETTDLSSNGEVSNSGLIFGAQFSF